MEFQSSMNLMNVKSCYDSPGGDARRCEEQGGGLVVVMG